MKQIILPVNISVPNLRASAPLDELAAVTVTFAVSVLVFGAVVLEAPGLDEDEDEDVLVELSALVVGGYSIKHSLLIDEMILASVAFIVA